MQTYHFVKVNEMITAWLLRGCRLSGRRWVSIHPAVTHCILA